jgi:ABC-2 type transport system permease protein
VSATSAIARRTLADSRTRTIAFALLFFVASAAQVLTYRSSYPTLEDRMQLARTFGDDQALRLLYGVPHDLLTVGGWAAWRLGALPIFAALWGVLGAVRALRAEEDAGRQELVLAGVVGRQSAFLAALVGVAGGAVILWLALFAGLLTGRPGVAGSAYLTLSLLSPLPVFVGAGALASQLAPTRRTALALGTGALAVALLLRMVADTTSLGWLRWATPLGWAEELRPFADPRPLVMLLPATAAVLLLVAAARIAAWRDVGAGLLASRDSAPPRLRLLSSPATLALRTLRGGFAAWLAAVGAFALILGVISDSASSGISERLEQQLEKLGAAVNTPAGLLGFASLFFVLAVSLFACFQLSAVREEETEQRLETLLALPVGRVRWLATRLLLAAAGAAALALAAGLLAWIGAASQGADVSLRRLFEAGANCLPAALLFLGLGALAVAIVPRAATTIAYALVGIAFLWEVIGALFEAPGWLLGLSPFHQVALVPAEPFAATSALVMLALAAGSSGVAVWAFARRDLITS